MQAVVIGPLVLNVQLLLLAAFVISGYLILSIRLKQSGQRESSAVLDDLLQIAIIGLIIWKFSTIIWDWKSVIRNPMSLLYFTGGTKGILLASLYTILALGYRIYRSRMSVWFYADAILTWVLAGEGAAALLRFLLEKEGFSAWGVTLLNAVLVVMQIRKKNELGQVHPFVVTLLGYSVGRFALTLFGDKGETLVFGFQGYQLVLIGIACLSLTAKVILEKRNEL